MNYICYEDLMRALHTADWHIGQTLNGWSREREHEVFFARLADILDEEGIDLLLVAGDVFDNTNPSGESQRLLYRSLAEFKRRRPRLVTVVSGGNHDPALRLEAPADLLESLDIHAIGTVRRQAGVLDAREHLVAIPGPSGDPALYVLAIPFLRAADLTGVSFSNKETRLSIEAAARAFHSDIVATVEETVGDLPLIATGHLHCTGGIESEGAERRILIGGSHAVPPDIFPSRLDYVALGHLHGPQNLDGGRVRYSGSCFPLSASEIRYSHGVTILEIDGRSITTRHRNIPWPAPVLRLPKSGTMNLEDLEAALDEIVAVPDVGLRPLVYVEIAAGPDAPAVIIGKAEVLLRLLPVRLAGIRIHRAADKDLADEASGAPVVSLQETQPEDLFVQAFSRKHGIAPDDRHLAGFRDILGSL
jgi:exonuclease SbcD